MHFISFHSNLLYVNMLAIETFFEFTRNLKRWTTLDKCDNFVIEIKSECNGTINFGIKGDCAFVEHVPHNLMPPYKVTYNDTDNTEDVYTLDYFGEETEFYINTFININSAIDAINYFWHTGQLTTDILWHEE